MDLCILLRSLTVVFVWPSNLAMNDIHLPLTFMAWWISHLWRMLFIKPRINVYFIQYVNAGVTFKHGFGPVKTCNWLFCVFDGLKMSKKDKKWD